MTKEQAIQKVIDIAMAEVGYLEKASGFNLDSKTANAGDRNYTKYGRDLNAVQPSNISKADYWCACFQSWVFYKAFGLDMAKKVLYGDIDDYTVTMANRFKSGNAFHSSPAVGDIVFFKNSQRICHVGLVYKVDGAKVYTIEGNTSSGNDIVVANGGAVALKSYALNNSRIAGYGRPKYELLAGNDSIPAVVDTTATRSALREFIDISHHNTINLALTAQRYKDVIIRVGYRASVSGELTLDKKFLQHAKEALNAGMRIGVYFYDQAINEEEAIQQADWVVGLIRPLPISFPVFIDTEYVNEEHTGRADNISKEQRTKNIAAFCERITFHGYLPGVYASDSWFKSMVNYEPLKKYFIWCARYSTDEPTIAKYEMWQYGSTNVPGSVKPIDINRLYLEFPTVKPYESLNPTPQAKPSTVSPIIPTVTTNTADKNVADTSNDTDVINTVTASSLNVRNKSNVTGKIVGNLKKGDNVDILDYLNGWVKISKKDEWCSYKYINSTKGKISNCNKLNCRKSPVDGTILFVLSAGSEVNILNHDKKTDWYYIEFQGRAGYVSNKYITL